MVRIGLRRFAFIRAPRRRWLLAGVAIGAAVADLSFLAGRQSENRPDDATMLDLVVVEIPWMGPSAELIEANFEAAKRQSDVEFERRSDFLPGRVLHECGAKAVMTHVSTDGYSDATIPFDEAAIGISQCLSDERRVQVYLREHR